MSADFLVGFIAAPEETITEPDYDAGRKALNECEDLSAFNFDEYDLMDVSDEMELDDDEEDDPQKLIQLYRETGRRIIDRLEKAMKTAEITYITIGGYRVWLSGGVSYGDTPTGATQVLWDTDKLPETVVEAMGLVPEPHLPLTNSQNED